MTKEQVLEDINSIIFDQSGAIDFWEQINIELSETKKEGFTKIHPFELLLKLNKIKHIQHIIDNYFYKILKCKPNIRDLNKDLPEEERFISVFYKCYKKYAHFHEPYGTYHYSKLTLLQSLRYIQFKNLAIRIP